MVKIVKNNTVLKIIFIGVLAFFVFGCSGCSNVNQLQEKLIVRGIAVDSHKKGVEVTMQVFDAENSISTEEGKVTVVNAVGETVLDAFNNISKKTGKEPLYSQNLVLIIGKKCAEKGINSIMDFFIRYYEVRPSVSVFIAKSYAKDIISCEYEKELVTCEEISALNSTGLLNASGKPANVMEVINSLTSDISDPAVMALKVSKDKHGERPEVYGTAIFNEDKLISFLDSDLSEGFLLMSENINGGTFVIDIDDMAGKATMTFDNASCNYSFKISENGLTVYADIYTDLNLYALDDAKEKKLPSKYISTTENKANELLKETCTRFINTAIKEYHSDLLNLGKRLRLCETNYFKSIEENYKDYMVNAEYIVNVKTTLKNIGQEINPA